LILSRLRAIHQAMRASRDTIEQFHQLSAIFADGFQG
jgi:hypothetical protein